MKLNQEQIKDIERLATLHLKLRGSGLTDFEYNEYMNLIGYIDYLPLES